MMQIYLFGGECKDGQLLSDLWRFDMQAMEWESLTPLQSDAATGYHPSAPYPGNDNGIEIHRCAFLTPNLPHGHVNKKIFLQKQ
jgi:hypothetical protein